VPLLKLIDHLSGRNRPAPPSGILTPAAKGERVGRLSGEDCFSGETGADRRTAHAAAATGSRPRSAPRS
jgi:hypothetical protein